MRWAYRHEIGSHTVCAGFFWPTIAKDASGWQYRTLPGASLCVSDLAAALVEDRLECCSPLEVVLSKISRSPLPRFRLARFESPRDA